MRGSGSVSPSPPRSRGSAQEILDVSNLWRPGTEEKVEDEVLGVLCGARDIDFVQEERLGLPCWTMILAICV